MKTLTEVEPRTAINATNTPGDSDSVFRIGAPGSYYLTGDLLIPPGKRGIEIDADDVTLDLSGFRVGGLAGTYGGVEVMSDVDRMNITVRNGIIRNVQGAGVRLRPAFVHDSTSCRAEDLIVEQVGGDGISVGSGGMVRNCVVNGSEYNGISASAGALIESCRVTDAGADGIEVTGAAVVRGCIVVRPSFAGISVGSHSTISESAVTRSSNQGIVVQDGTVVSGCTASYNEAQGIICQGRGSTIVNCTATKNTEHGIRVAGRTLVKSNTCDENGYSSGVGANISVSGNGNRIEGNQCSMADVGIAVIWDQNVIVGNTCMNNSLNWDIAAGNVCGPVIDRRSPNSPAIQGNSGAGSMGSTDPNANYTF